MKRAIIVVIDSMGIGAMPDHAEFNDIAECTSLKAKISYTNGASTELKVGSALRGICQDIVKYNMWDYYFPSPMLVALDTTTVR